METSAPVRDRPRLRPGLAWARRDDAHLQVGLDAPARVLLPDHPDVRALLTALDRGDGTLPATPVADQALARLEAAGLLVDAHDTAGGPPVLLAQHGRDAGRRRARRAARTVSLRGSPGGVARLRALLDASGVTTATGARSAGDSEGALVVLVAEGPLHRATSDALVRSDVEHLVVELGPRRCRVGPLVLPGQTACLRCVDAHEAEREPGRRLLLAQLAAHPRSTPVDPVLTSMALGWAARDVVRHLDGDRPVTWSATTDLHLDDDAPTTTTWLRHPHCGCAWDVLD